jgi:hypothetical protein
MLDDSLSSCPVASLSNWGGFFVKILCKKNFQIKKCGPIFIPTKKPVVETTGP